MCGEECLVGVTSLEAWDILTKAPPIVEFVLTRRKDIPVLSSPSTETTTQSIPRPLSLLGQKRRMSYSLHFSSTATSTEDIKTALRYEVEDDTDSKKGSPLPLQRNATENYFTVILNRNNTDERLGIGIHGGKDHPQLPEIYVCFALIL